VACHVAGTVAPVGDGAVVGDGVAIVVDGAGRLADERPRVALGVDGEADSGRVAHPISTAEATTDSARNPKLM